MFNKFMMGVNKNAPTILHTFGIIGFGVTIALSINNTFKAGDIINEYKKQVDGDHTTKDKVAVDVLKCYTPTIFAAGYTLLTLSMSHSTSNSRYLAATGGLVSLASAMDKYTMAIKDEFGEEGYKKIKRHMMANYEDSLVDRDVPEQTHNSEYYETLTFYDEIGERYFEASMCEVDMAIKEINSILNRRNYCTMNDFYEVLGLESIPLGDVVGWLQSGKNYKASIDFIYDEVLINDDILIYVLTNVGGPFRIDNVDADI